MRDLALTWRATWHTLIISPHGSYRVTHVSNPLGRGYVSLRSIVKDVHGDSTTETIIRAYLVTKP